MWHNQHLRWTRYKWRGVTSGSDVQTKSGPLALCQSTREWRGYIKLCMSKLPETLMLKWLKSKKYMWFVKGTRDFDGRGVQMKLYTKSSINKQPKYDMFTGSDVRMPNMHLEVHQLGNVSVCQYAPDRVVCPCFMSCRVIWIQVWLRVPVTKLQSKSGSSGKIIPYLNLSLSLIFKVLIGA